MTKTKGKKGLTEIVFVLDESGSMSPQKNDTIGGFNEFIETQRKMPGEAKFTLIKFNSSWSGDDAFQVVYDGADLADVKDLNEETYAPGGGTALLDAVGIGIDKVKARLKKTKKTDRAEKVVFVVLTDGEENSSREYTTDIIKKAVKGRQKKGWEFLFLGADMDAWDEGSKIGLGKMSASISKQDLKGAFARTAVYTASARSSTANATMDYFSSNYSDEQVQQELNKLQNEDSEAS